VFSNFLRKSRLDKDFLASYAHENLNSALLSDYDRADYYGPSGNHEADYYENLKCALLQFFEGIIRKRSIDIVLYENVSNSFAHFAFFACRKMNVAYKGLVMSRLPGRFFVSTDPLKDYEVVEKAV